MKNIGCFEQYICFEIKTRQVTDVKYRSYKWKRCRYWHL